MRQVIFVMIATIFIALPVDAKPDLRDLPPGRYLYTHPKSGVQETYFKPSPLFPDDPLKVPATALPLEYIPLVLDSPGSGDGKFRRAAKGVSKFLHWSGLVLSDIGRNCSNQGYPVPTSNDNESLMDSPSFYESEPILGSMLSRRTADPNLVSAMSNGILGGSRTTSLTDPCGSQYNVSRRGSNFSISGMGKSFGNEYSGSMLGDYGSISGMGRAFGKQYSVSRFGDEYRISGSGRAIGENYTLRNFGGRWYVGK